MRTIFWIGFTLLWPTVIFSQRDCGTTAYMEKLMLKDPSIAQKKKAIESFTYSYLNPPFPGIQRDENSPASTRRIIIPVVVHILYNKPGENISDDQVMSQIEALNKDFSKLNEDFVKVPDAFKQFTADCEIQFQLSRVDPEGRVTTGITRRRTNMEFWVDDDKMKSELSGGTGPWDTHQYLNIWVCNLVSGLLGYSSFPGTPEDKDGVVIRWSNFGTTGNLSSDFNKGRTTTHEVGHWLNLIHLWGDVNCGDDEVGDTPKQRSYNRGCPTFPRMSMGCENGPDGDMFMNFMDFVDDGCMNMFTLGQKERMRSLFARGGFRESITSSLALGEPWNHNSPPTGNSNLLPGTLHVFPNPAVERTIILESSSDINLAGKTFALHSSTGQLILTNRLAGNKLSLDVSSLKSGIYFIRVGDKNEKLVTQFVKY
jgi:Pregnancy-associated plasma protein-A/Secretion system C-terminal sorting domain